MERLFQDSNEGDLESKSMGICETVHGQVPTGMASGGDMAWKGDETHVYFKTSKSVEKSGR